MRLSDRYLLEELVAPFVVGVLVILVMLLGDQLYQLLRLVITKGVDLQTITRLLLFMMPDMMVMAFPLATVLAVSTGVSRLVREREWDSLRVGGCSLARLLLPIALFGLVVATLSWVVDEQVAPPALAQFNRIRSELALADPTVVIDPQRWFRPGSSRAWFYVDEVNDATGEMARVIVFTDERNDFPTALFAQRAWYREQEFHLDHAVRHTWRPDGTLRSEARTDEVTMRIERLQPKLVGRALGAEEMSAAQLRELIQQHENQGIQRSDQVIDLNLKYAGPAACLILALLCVPLNILAGSRGNFVGLLITAVMAIVYFLLLQLGESMARNGVLQHAPALGAWLPVILFSAAALLLLRRCR